MRDNISAERISDDAELSVDSSDDAIWAVGNYFTTHRGLLQGFARKLAGDLLDPGDLLADAVAAAISRSAGGYRIENIGAYLFAAMRNRVKDELRSPRSRTVPLISDISPADGEEFRHIDAIHERAMVRRALRTLPTDQQRALVHIAVVGTRARELTSVLNRPAPAIHALVYRAKAGMRRALLRELLLWGDPPAACVRFAESLPDIFPVSAPDACDLERFAHVADCARCREAWESLDAMARSVDGL